MRASVNLLAKWNVTALGSRLGPVMSWFRLVLRLRVMTAGFRNRWIAASASVWNWFMAPCSSSRWYAVRTLSQAPFRRLDSAVV